MALELSLLDDPLIFLQEEPPAKMSQWQENAGVSTPKAGKRGQASRSTLCALPESLDPNTCYGKTWREVSIPKTDQTSSNSSLRLGTAGILLPGESSMHNTSPAQIFTRPMAEWTSLLPAQFRNGADGYGSSVCGLSDVLEQMRPELLRYFLSQTALKGIQRRADARGKTLPPLLGDAIDWMLEWWDAHPELATTEKRDEDGSQSSR